ncbi:uncharacterized protein Dwil_GK27900 [Drosophila willistoni]|uniref:Uncharacterized protein n=1 Tax=Drosophila willistoni TaxID=7260 RepID=A0A0Q9WTJ9_DROWI|nr:uncharacterized protein Dwil_GK27900 [Drosophila willistoni]
MGNCSWNLLPPLRNVNVNRIVSNAISDRLIMAEGELPHRRHLNFMRASTIVQSRSLIMAVARQWLLKRLQWQCSNSILWTILSSLNTNYSRDFRFS